MHELVTYRGVEIEVIGEYVPGEPAVLTADPFDSSPAEAGCIEGHSFMLMGENVTDLLEEVEDEILDLAIEQYEEERKAV